jgi:hypothetical protein
MGWRIQLDRILLTLQCDTLQDRLGGVGDRVKSLVQFLTPKQEVSTAH